MPNPVVHFEIISGQGEPEVKEFYSTLFGWQINSDNPMNYGMVEAGSSTGIGGGIAPGDEPSRTTLYVEVSDLQAVLDEAEKLGGKTVMPVTVIPDTVTLAQFTDPAGNLIGLVKSA